MMKIHANDKNTRLVDALIPANPANEAPRHRDAQGKVRTERSHWIRRLLRRLRRTATPMLRQPVIRQIRCVQLRRMRPLAEGRQAGTPIVRHYWANFLEANRDDIRGHGLEIGTTATLRQYGGSRLTRADAIDLNAHGPDVNVVADLARADGVASDQYDCFINQFTMHLIYDLDATLYHSIRVLKPGGVLLVNFPCVDYYFAQGLDMGTGAPLYMHWWFTPLQVENLLRRAGLAEADFRLDISGNLFARVAYQMNMSAEELSRDELTYQDPGHPLLICARVVKPRAWNIERPDYRQPWLPSDQPARWSVETGHYSP